jgi:nitroreductase
MTMGIEHLLTATRSARRSLDLDAPIDIADVRDALDTGLHAANGTNNQSWRWLVISDQDTRRQLGDIYREAYLTMTGGNMVGDLLADHGEIGRVMASTEWLVDNLAQVPLHIIPCYEPYLPRFDNDDSFRHATLYGSIFPAVWNFQLALHQRGYGTCITTMHLLRETAVAELLGIPDAYVQACLLPVARLKPGTHFRPAPRKPLHEVIAFDHWNRPLIEST